MEQAKMDRSLQEELAALKSDLASLRTDTKDIASTLIAQGKEHAAAVKQRVVQAAEQSTKATREYVERHPIRSVAIAFGAGALVGTVAGLLLRRR